MSYSDTWRAHRRVVQQWFRPNAGVDYQPLLVSRAKVLLAKLVEHPEDGYQILRQCVIFAADPPVSVHQLTIFGIFGAASHAGALALRLIYGHDSDSGDKSLIEVTEQAMLMMTKIMFPAAIIVNTFPFCELKFNHVHCLFKIPLTETLLF